ncbi:MAG: PEGA domain-containing protein [Myxococcales bacterium]
MSSSVRSAAFLSLPLLLAVALPLTARAAPQDGAKAFFQAGAQAYGAGRFEAAVQAFEEAYRLAPMPAILFSMAQTERKQFYVSKQRPYLERAITHYRAYVEAKGATRRAEAADALAELEAALARLSPQTGPAALEPPKPTKARLMVTTQAPQATVTVDDQPAVVAPFIDELAPGRHHVKVAAEGFLTEERDIELAVGPPAGLDLPLKERPGRLAVTAPSGTDVHVDGKKLGEAPLGAALELPAGPHSVTLVQRGMQPWSGELVLERGKEASLAPTMTRTAQRTASYAVLGSAAVAALGGVACVLVATNREHNAANLLDQQRQGNITSQQLDHYHLLVRQRDAWRTATEASFGSAAALLTVGVLMYWLDRPAVTSGPVERPSAPERSPLELGVSPTLVPGGAGVTAVGRF